jgi:hypothetical protein
MDHPSKTFFHHEGPGDHEEKQNEHLVVPEKFDISFSEGV